MGTDMMGEAVFQFLENPESNDGGEDDSEYAPWGYANAVLVRIQVDLEEAPAVFGFAFHNAHLTGLFSGERRGWGTAFAHVRGAGFVRRRSWTMRGL